MKKDGIQTRNRKLAAKAKKKRMHDFFKPLDPRFSAYTGMHGTAGSYLTNPMSQYYAGQMGQMSSFMSNSMPSAMSMGSPMSHLSGKKNDSLVMGLSGSSNGTNGSHDLSPWLRWVNGAMYPTSFFMSNKCHVIFNN